MAYSGRLTTPFLENKLNQLGQVAVGRPGDSTGGDPDSVRFAERIDPSFFQSEREQNTQPFSRC